MESGKRKKNDQFLAEKLIFQLPMEKRFVYTCTKIRTFDYIYVQLVNSLRIYGRIYEFTNSRILLRAHEFTNSPIYEAKGVDVWVWARWGCGWARGRCEDVGVVVVVGEVWLRVMVLMWVWVVAYRDTRHRHSHPVTHPKATLQTHTRKFINSWIRKFVNSWGINEFYTTVWLIQKDVLYSQHVYL
jgi:hypothetical protein